MTSSSFFNALIYLLVVGIILGILYFLIDKAPFINGMFKTILQWLIYAAGAVVLIDFLLGLTGHAFLHLR